MDFISLKVWVVRRFTLNTSKPRNTSQCLIESKYRDVTFVADGINWRHAIYPSRVKINVACAITITLHACLEADILKASNI